MKTSCIYHKDQLITNFCLDKHCLMPLCPECISQHTQYHEDQRTRPQYSTIHQVMADVHTQITNCIESLNQDKHRNGMLIINIQTVSDKIKEKIQAAKELVYQTIEQSFLLLEKDINRQLEKYHEEKSIYCLSKTHRQDKIIIENLDELQAMKNSLKSDRGLSNMIYFLREKVAQVSKFHTQFTSYLHMNESYQPKLEINTEALYSIDSLIARIIKIGTISISKSKRVERGDRGQRIQGKGKQNVSISPLKLLNPTTFPSASLTTQKLRQRHNIPIIQSEVKSYSPHLSRVKFSKQKKPIKTDKIDGQYQQLSKKVAIMRQENDRLSRILTRNQSKF